MAAICRNCDHPTASDAEVGKPCAGCGKPLTLPDAAFEAPTKGADQKLEVDGEWQAAREAKQAAAAAPPPKPKRKVGAMIAGAVVAAACISGIIYATRTKSDAPVRETSIPATVSIKIVAKSRVLIRIDDRSAGMTPLTFHVPISKNRHVITATIDGVAVAKDVIADQDQVIDLSAP